MAIINATLNQLDPQCLALASAGMVPTLTDEQFKAYNTLYTLLAKEAAWDQEKSPVLTVFNSKVYLPKLYQVDSLPWIQWGTELLHLEDGPQLTYNYVTGSTGYTSPHVSIIFTPEAKVKGAKELYQVMFPISLEQGDDNVNANFLSQVAVDEEGALSAFVRKPDPTMGLEWLDEVAGPEAKEFTVQVLNAIVRKGSEEYGGKPYTTATVKCGELHPSQVFKVRTNTQTSATLQGPLKFPLNVPGVVRRAKKNLNLQELTLSPENIDTSKLV